MTPDKEAVRTYFAKLGLAHEIADIYLALHLHGPQTISQLARNSQVERTRIYRLLDQLMDSGLLEVETRYKRGIIRAAPIANLKILISKREQELQSLTDELQLIEQVLGRNSLVSPASRVQFYQGPEGIKQMFWNETKATTEVLGILYENMQVKTQGRFFERWVAECNANAIHFRGIIGDTFQASQQSWYGNINSRQLEHWQSRKVASSIYPITHSTIMYNDVVAYYIWKDGEVFGIEIYNPDIAESNKRLFELLWRQATEVSESAKA